MLHNWKTAHAPIEASEAFEYFEGSLKDASWKRMRGSVDNALKESLPYSTERRPIDARCHQRGLNELAIPTSYVSTLGELSFVGRIS